MTPAERCRSYLAAFATGDPDAILTHVGEGFVNEHTAALGSGCRGRDEYARRLPAFLASLPGLRYDVEDVIADGPRVWVAYTLRAVVDGRDVAVRGVMRFRVEDDLIAARTDYWDSLVFQQQVAGGVTSDVTSDRG